MTEEKNKYQAQLFSNRILKNYKSLKKWARKNRISCLRIYDKDIPEVPLALDLYTFLPPDINEKEECAKYIKTLNEEISQNTKKSLEMLKEESLRTYALLYLYERPYEKSKEEEDLWLGEMKNAVSKTLLIPEENVILKVRRKQSAGEKQKRMQYEKEDSQNEIKGIVQESGQLFITNLSSYIDTGLFNDMRPLRKIIREEAGGKNVLNLFSYTGSFSVFAAEGNANTVTSVDLSNTYLDWAKQNMILNGFSSSQKYKYIRSDCIKFLNEESKNPKTLYDIIILDSPTFSNSKKTEDTLDINRDWFKIVQNCINLLSINGVLYFSTNSRNLVFDENKIKNAECEEITQKTIPEDYRNAKIHRVWKIKKLNVEY